LNQLSGGLKEQVGRSGFVRVGDDGKNLFTFNEIGKL
jgi:hypothetical protein